MTSFPLLSADPGVKARKELLLRRKKKQSARELIKRRTPKSGIWICNNCTWTGDFFFMDRHSCKYNVKNNFEKVARQLEYENERYR